MLGWIRVRRFCGTVNAYGKCAVSYYRISWYEFVLFTIFTMSCRRKYSKYLYYLRYPACVRSFIFMVPRCYRTLWYTFDNIYLKLSMKTFIECLLPTVRCLDSVRGTDLVLWSPLSTWCTILGLFNQIATARICPCWYNSGSMSRVFPSLKLNKYILGLSASPIAFASPRLE